MCGGGSPQMPKTYQPSEPVNGVWTPVKAYTQAERDALLAEANKPTLITNRYVTEAGETETTQMGVDQAAVRRANEQIADNAGQAAADAQKLASIGRQDPKTVRATGAKVGATSGGPTSLVTGGTASSALTTSRKAPTATLLGG